MPPIIYMTVVWDMPNKLRKKGSPRCIGNLAHLGDGMSFRGEEKAMYILSIDRRAVYPCALEELLFNALGAR
jgi:hypothetical protein